MRWRLFSRCITPDRISIAESFVPKMHPSESNGAALDSSQYVGFEGSLATGATLLVAVVSTRTVVKATELMPARELGRSSRSLVRPLLDGKFGGGNSRAPN